MPADIGATTGPRMPPFYDDEGLTWTDADERAAADEGWAFFTVEGSSRIPDGTLDLQRVDDDMKFDSDAHALMHVVSEAVRDETGLHFRALAHWKRTSPARYRETLTLIMRSLP